MEKNILIPDLGTDNAVEVIEVLVKSGDKVNADDPLLTLESDKASMDVPAPFSGVVKTVKVKVGDSVKQGSLVFIFDCDEKEQVDSLAEGETAQKSDKESGQFSSQVNVSQSSSDKKVLAEENPSFATLEVPDLGNSAEVEIIEILVKVNDKISKEQSIVVLESDKASIEVPSPYEGTIEKLLVKVGDKVSQGNALAHVRTIATAKPEKSLADKPEASQNDTDKATQNLASFEKLAEEKHTNSEVSFSEGKLVNAGPAVRRLARELGVDLQRVLGTGLKGFIQKSDVKAYVKLAIQSADKNTSTSSGALHLAKLPAVDFAQFGPIETQPLSRIKKLSGKNLQRNWLMVPHVTQFDEADITELEAFRKECNAEAKQKGTKVTPLAFIMKAVVGALKVFPQFNASLDDSGENLILKKYYHIGVAIDTPNGLVVAVIRDVDQKSIYQLSQELAEMSEKARTKGLSGRDMQGSSFTISSLGGIGGTAFTPIVNLPDVAILGISRSSMKPVYQGNQFVPRLILPLSLSYDHRVIDGADGARFSTYLGALLGDIRKLLL